MMMNVWNSLPSTVNFSSLNCFKQSIGSVDFSVFLKCIYKLALVSFLSQLKLDVRVAESILVLGQ